MSDITGLILLPHLRVQNANAISGPLSWGFPSPTAFTGFAHALTRKLADRIEHDVAGIGIVCHRFEPQVAQPAGARHHIFCLTRNPINKDGGAPSIAEEGRAHLEVSLLLALREHCSAATGQYLAEDCLHAAYGMRLAGGSPLYRQGLRHQASWHPLAGTEAEDAQTFRKLRRRLLPGFALVQRDDLLATHLAEMRDARPGSTTLDALLDITRRNIEPTLIPATEATPLAATEWKTRHKPGWIVPLPVGYAGISPLYPPGVVANTRDAQTPFRFVESLYSLGQWISPHRLRTLEQMLWTQESDPENGLYRCRNRYPESLTASFSDTLIESPQLTQEKNHA